MNYATRYDLPEYLKLKTEGISEVNLWLLESESFGEKVSQEQAQSIKDSAKLLFDCEQVNIENLIFDNHQDSGTTWTDGTNTYKTSNGQILKSVSGDYEHAGKDVSYKSPFEVVL